MGLKNVVLYTIQDPRKYAGDFRRPADESRKAQQAFVDLARYLGWDHWIWALMDLKDFENAWMHIHALANGDLWTLSVPRQEVKWCGLAAYCEHRGAVRDWFYKDPEIIRNAGDKPVALIKVPVIPGWVSRKLPARQAFQEAGLLRQDVAA